MYHDMRSPFQREQDAKWCPTCGHRPQDRIDELVGTTTGGTSIGRETCSMCNGSGRQPSPVDTTLMACSSCGGTGTVIR